jgi:hypothetical protein
MSKRRVARRVAWAGSGPTTPRGAKIGARLATKVWCVLHHFLYLPGWRSSRPVGLTTNRERSVLVRASRLQWRRGAGGAVVGRRGYRASRRVGLSTARNPSHLVHIGNEREGKEAWAEHE